jgi:hypothetical protein
MMVLERLGRLLRLTQTMDTVYGALWCTERAGCAALLSASGLSVTEGMVV